MHVRIDQTYDDVRQRRPSHGAPLKDTGSAGIIKSSTSLHHRAWQSTSYHFSSAKEREPCYFAHSARPSKLTVVEIKSRQPRKRQASILLWTDLSISSIDRLNESASSDHVRRVLADLFVLDEYRTDPRSAIVMDLFFHTLQFAKQEQFSREKTSAFFSIIKHLFEMCIETPFVNNDITYIYFKDLLVCHSVDRPPYSMKLFSTSDIMRISQHTVNTFFRHFDLYKYAFTPQVSLDLTLKYSEMPLTPPPSLADEDSDNDDADTVRSSVYEIEGIESKIGSNYLEGLQDEINATEVGEFLLDEAKKIRERMSAQMNRAANAMYTKITEMLAEKTSHNVDRKSYKHDLME